MLDEAGFALLVLTAESERTDGVVLARQNVVNEAGLFQGGLGWRKAIVLREDGCEEFSEPDIEAVLATQGQMPKNLAPVTTSVARRGLEPAIHTLRLVRLRDGRLDLLRRAA